MIGELSALITAFCWSATSLIFTEAGKRIGVVQLNVTRLALAVVFLSFTILIANIQFVLSASQTYALIWSGIVGLVIGDTFLFYAFDIIGPRKSMMIMSGVPAVSAILAFIFLGEVLSFMNIIGMIITVFGIILVVSEKKNNEVKRNNQFGILFAVISTLGQSVGLIFAKQAFSLGEINGFVSAFVRIFSAVIILLPITIFLRKFKNPIPIFIKDKTALLLTTSGTFFGPYLGITLSLVAVAHTEVGIAATIMGTVPIIMLPLVKYYYKEKLSWKAIAGAFIAVIGVAILFLKF